MIANELNDRNATILPINAETIAAFRANRRRAERLINSCTGYIDKALADALEDFRRTVLVASGKLAPGHDYHDYVDLLERIDERMERYDDRDEWIIRLAHRIAA